MADGTVPATRDRIRVLRIIARLNVGGPAMHVVHLARGLDPERYDTRLLAGEVPEEEGDMTYFAQERGVEPVLIPALRRPVSPKDDLRALFAIRRHIREYRPDVVHTHTAKAGALGRLAAILEGVPVIVHTYHGHVLGGAYFSPRVTEAYRFIERQLARGTSRLIALTGMQADEMSGPLRVAPRDRFAVIPLGLDLRRFGAVDREAARAEVREELGVPETTRVAGIVGRLVPVKNHELLFEAWARVVAEASETERELWIVGSGEREAELKGLAERMGIDGSVRWLGWRRDLDRINAAVDLLALSSHDEGTPVALLEGLASGTSIVSTDVGGIREMLERTDSTGTVVPPGDVEALARGLSAGLGEVRSADADGRARVVDGYSVERLCARIDRLYTELLG